jgi:hypothetical protein
VERAGHGSFGVVLSANLRGQDGTLGEAIAIKKVLQDPMFMVSTSSHPLTAREGASRRAREGQESKGKR